MSKTSINWGAPDSRRSDSKPTSTRLSSSTDGHGSSNLIVTRGLQEILEKEYSKKGIGVGGVRTQKKKSMFPTGKAPKTVLCYLCGRGFGTSSICIHRPQCYLKQMIAFERGEILTRPVDPETHERQMQQKMDARREALQQRQAVDEVVVGGGAGPSQGMSSMSHLTGAAGASSGSMVGKDMAAYSDLDWDMYNAIQQHSAFSACPHCSRTFLPDRLKVHLRSCRPGHTSKPLIKRASPGTSGSLEQGVGSPVSPSNTKTATTSKPLQDRRIKTPDTTVPAAINSPSSAKEATTPLSRKNILHSKKTSGKTDRFPEVVLVVGGDGSSTQQQIGEAAEAGAAQEMKEDLPHVADAMATAAVPQPIAPSSFSIPAPPLPVSAGETPADSLQLVAYESGEVRNNVLVSHTIRLFPDQPEAIDLSNPLPPVHPPASTSSSPPLPSLTEGMQEEKSNKPRGVDDVQVERIDTTTEPLPHPSSDVTSSVNMENTNIKEARTLEVAPVSSVPSDPQCHLESPPTPTNDSAMAPRSIVPTPITKQTVVVQLATKDSTLLPCAHCHRTFHPSRIEKHESVCTERPVGSGVTSSCPLPASTAVPSSSSSSAAARFTAAARTGCLEPAEASLPPPPSLHYDPHHSSPLHGAHSTMNHTGGGIRKGTKREGYMTSDSLQSTNHFNSADNGQDTSGGFRAIRSTDTTRTTMSGKVRINKSLILKRKAAADKSIMYCGDCGAKLLKQGQVFCNACGMKTQEI